MSEISDTFGMGLPYNERQARLLKQEGTGVIMGKTKRQKLLDKDYSKGFGKESKAKNLEIGLGSFISTSESSVLTQSPKFKKAKIIDSGLCAGFAIDDLKIGGVAFPSVNKNGVICVGIIAWSSVAKLSKIETDKQKELFPCLEHEVRRLVAEAYKTQFVRSNQDPNF